MSQIDVADEPAFLRKLEQLKLQLEQARLSQRDASLKSSRELKILKRVINKLGDACLGYNSELDKEVISLQESLEKQQDISKLIPRLSILERILQKNTKKMETEKGQLDSRIRSSGETLQRIPGLPAQLKRELRNLLTFPSAKHASPFDQAVRLLGIYESSVKIITSNSAHGIQRSPELNKALLNQLSDDLQVLITELDFDGDSGELLSDVRIKLLNGTTAETLIELTLEVLKLVISGTQYERKTSENYLSQMTGGLGQVVTAGDKHIQQSESYVEHRSQMARELNQLSKNSKITLENATELEKARSTLNPLLDQIDMLSERLQHNEQREKMLLERMAHTQRQLESLQELSKSHKRRLDDQTERLRQDPLTKVMNRSAFIERLEVEYHKWIRSQHPLYLVLMDIDNFKALNDSFGFTAGDKALKIIARTITKELRKADCVARFGGEEFILLLPEMNESEIENLCHTLQKNISKLPFKFKQQSITITASVSITGLNDSDTPEILLDRLNSALSEARRKGSNQLIWK